LSQQSPKVVSITYNCQRSACLRTIPRTSTYSKLTTMARFSKEEEVVVKSKQITERKNSGDW
jgi:hypothetical protein